MASSNRQGWKRQGWKTPGRWESSRTGVARRPMSCGKCKETIKAGELVKVVGSLVSHADCKEGK